MAFASMDGGEDEPLAEINMVPLIDVMLVLLIIFMVTAPLLNLGVDVSLPQSNAKSIQDRKDPLIVRVDRDGRYALASLWEDDGAVIVYDAQSLPEIKRLPMSKPVGKYNVWNKITREEGTSH